MPNIYDDAMWDQVGVRHTMPSTNVRIAELEAAIAQMNDALNEIWSRAATKDLVQALGMQQLDKLMAAQNAAFALIGRK